MSEQDKASVKPTEDISDVPEKKDTVAYETYKRALAELKKYKEKASTYEQEKQQLTEKQLTEQNEFKKLWEAEKTKSSNALKALQEKEEAINNGLKYQAFSKHLGGKLASDDYAAFVPFDRIIINPETGKIDDDSAKLVASEFVKAHSKLVDFDAGKMPNVNAKGSTYVPSKKVEDMTSKELEAHILELNRQGIVKN